MVEAQVADVLYRIKPYDDGNPFLPIIFHVGRLRKFTLVASARYIPNDSVDADDHDEEGEELPLEGGPAGLPPPVPTQGAGPPMLPDEDDAMEPSGPEHWEGAGLGLTCH